MMSSLWFSEFILYSTILRSNFWHGAVDFEPVWSCVITDLYTQFHSHCLSVILLTNTHGTEHSISLVRK